MGQTNHYQIAPTRAGHDGRGNRASLDRQLAADPGRLTAPLELSLHRQGRCTAPGRGVRHDVQPVQPPAFAPGNDEGLFERQPTLRVAAEWHEHIGREALCNRGNTALLAPLARRRPGIQRIGRHEG